MHWKRACPYRETGQRRVGCEQPNVRRVNVLPPNLKRSLDDTYDAFKFCQCARRHLAEAQWCLNRGFDPTALMPRLLVAVAPITSWSERHCAMCLYFRPKHRANQESSYIRGREGFSLQVYTMFE